MDETRNHPVRWMRYLMYLSIANIVNLILANFPLGGLTRWVGIGLSAALVYLLYMLASSNDRYRKAAIFGAVALVGNLLSISLLSLVTSVCSIVAEYREYQAHSELVAGRDDRLSNNWSFLFWAQFVIGLLTGVGAVGGVMIAAALDLEESQILAVLTPVITLITLIPAGLYILYLHRTVRCLESEAPVE